eukprot:317179-Chlamydomonas_euryale.AAC.1
MQSGVAEAVWAFAPDARWSVVIQSGPSGHGRPFLKGVAGTCAPRGQGQAWLRMPLHAMGLSC